MKHRANTTERDRLVIRLDDLTSRIVIKAYGPRCVTCGRQRRRLTNGHLFGRSHFSTRFDIHWGGNCYPQCWRCNTDHVADRQPYFDWYRRTFGPVALAALEQRWHRVTKLDDTDLATLDAVYTNMVWGVIPLPSRVGPVTWPVPAAKVVGRTRPEKPGRWPF